MRDGGRVRETGAKEERNNQPRLLPAVAMPVARAFLVEKYVETMATLGTKRHPNPMPMQTAWESMISQ